MSEKKLQNNLFNQDTAKDFSTRHLISFMVGVYVAINAIHDAYLLVEGPDCTYMKTYYVQGNQDYLSSLTSLSGFHRIANTALHPSQMAKSREEHISSMLLKMGKEKETGCVMITSMPCSYITGVDFERLCRSVSENTGKPVIHIPGKSLSNDWLKGYEETLIAIANQIKFEKPTPKGDNVAIVGYLYDRNEEDNKGNIRELTRLLHNLGLNLISVWAGGQNFAEFETIKNAGTIISFPYGRSAAKILAQRLKLRLLETDLPFGLTATENWIRKLGNFFGREVQAEKLIDNELKKIIPKLEWVIPFLFQNRNFGYIGDPYLINGLAEIMEMIGGTLKFAIITNRKTYLEFVNLKNNSTTILIEPTANTISNFYNTYGRNNEIDCMITNNTGLDFISPQQHAIVEFGFPAYNVHALYDRPYLGFKGFLAFIDTMANQMRMFETFIARTH